MTWPFQNETAIAFCLIALWIAAIWYVARTDEWLPLVGLLTIPLLGFAVDRGYWGLLATPFAVWLAADGVLVTVHARRLARTRGSVVVVGRRQTRRERVGYRRSLAAERRCA
jgi:hypothetical protein